MKKKKNNLVFSFNKKKPAPKKPKKAVEPFVSKYRPIDYEALKETAEIQLTIKLDQTRNESSTFEMKIPCNMTLRKVVEKINERHCNSCKNIRIYIVEDSAKKYMDVFLYKTFNDLNIKPGENLILYYEYEPINHPLLEAGLV